MNLKLQLISSKNQQGLSQCLCSHLLVIRVVCKYFYSAHTICSCNNKRLLLKSMELLH